MRYLIPFLAIVFADILADQARAQRTQTATPLGNDPLVFFTSEGQDPFRLIAQRKESAGYIPRSNALYYGSLELDSNGVDLLATSWDELYRINAPSGESTLLGKVRAENTFRAWFSKPIIYKNVAVPGPATINWFVRASIEVADFDTLEFFHTIDEVGTTAVGKSRTYPNTWFSIMAVL